MNRSPSIAAIAAALAKAQGEIENAIKDSANPFFKSKYADLAGIRDAIREPVSKNGLSYTFETHAGAEGAGVSMLLMHESGEWIEYAPLLLPLAKEDAQGVGSVLTYARRYLLASVFGVATEDDDGEAAVGRPQNRQKAQAVTSAILDMARKELRSAADKGTPALAQAFKNLPPEVREAVTADKDHLKKRAAEVDKELSNAAA